MNIYNKHIITVNINGKAQANPNLLAYQLSLMLLAFQRGRNPAEFAFEENDIMIDHFKNKFKKGRFILIQHVSH